MMKIRYALLLSVSCLGFGSLANAGLTPDITPVGKNTSIFTLRGTPADESLLRLSHSSYTHLASQSKLLSASVIARRTSSDEAIHNNINGSPRRINSPRDDTDDFLSTQHKELEASRLLLPEQDTADLPLTASVCRSVLSPTRGIVGGMSMITAERIHRIILPAELRVEAPPAGIMMTIGRWTTKNAAIKRDIPKPPAVLFKTRLIIAHMTTPILKNVTANQG